MKIGNIRQKILEFKIDYKMDLKDKEKFKYK